MNRARNEDGEVISRCVEGLCGLTCLFKGWGVEGRQSSLQAISCQDERSTEVMEGEIWFDAHDTGLLAMPSPPSSTTVALTLDRNDQPGWEVTEEVISLQTRENRLLEFLMNLEAWLKR